MKKIKFSEIFKKCGKMPIELVSEDTEQDKIYISVINQLENPDSISDIIIALQNLEMLSSQGYLKANSVINDIKISLTKIASQRVITYN